MYTFFYVLQVYIFLSLEEIVRKINWETSRSFRYFYIAQNLFYQREF